MADNLLNRNAIRLLREQWISPAALAQEMFMIMSDEPVANRQPATPQLQSRIERAAANAPNSADRPIAVVRAPQPSLGDTMRRKQSAAEAIRGLPIVGAPLGNLPVSGAYDAEGRGPIPIGFGSGPEVSIPNYPAGPRRVESQVPLEDGLRTQPIASSAATRTPLPSLDYIDTVARGRRQDATQRQEQQQIRTDRRVDSSVRPHGWSVPVGRSPDVSRSAYPSTVISTVSPATQSRSDRLVPDIVSTESPATQSRSDRLVPDIVSTESPATAHAARLAPLVTSNSIKHRDPALAIGSLTLPVPAHAAPDINALGQYTSYQPLGTYGAYSGMERLAADHLPHDYPTIERDSGDPFARKYYDLRFYPTDFNSVMPTWTGGGTPAIVAQAVGGAATGDSGSEAAVQPQTVQCNTFSKGLAAGLDSGGPTPVIVPQLAAGEFVPAGAILLITQASDNNWYGQFPVWLADSGSSASTTSGSTGASTIKTSG